MLDELYNAKILALAGNIGGCERLAEPDGTAKQHSRLCGSTITVDVKMDGNIVSAYGQDVKACMLGQAASAIMAEHVIGSSAQELNQLRDQVAAMLKENGDPPQGKWADIAAFLPVRNVKQRHASTLLVFEAVCEAIKNAHKVA